VRSEVRHRLKEDRFAVATGEAVHWTVEHRQKLVVAGVVAGVVLAVLLGGFYFYQYRTQQASAELGQAIRTSEAFIRPANTPPDPNLQQESYASIKDRARAAEKKFQDVADRYGYTNPGQMARYFVGVMRLQEGNTAGAEQQLKEVANSRNRELASLAKMALAGLYASSNRTKQAIDLYNEVISNPTNLVSKTDAQLQLAAFYEQTQPQEALKVYQQIQASDPTGAAGEMAMNKIAEIKK
jgi:tetratricopeptide (TPR) repeat protein